MSTRVDNDAATGDGVGGVGASPPNALYRMAAALIAAPDFESTIHVALSQLREVTGARYAACGIVDPATGGFGRYLTVGLDDPTVAAIGEPPRGRGVFGLLLRQLEPITIDDIRRHPESYGFPVHHPVMTSFMGVGMWSHGEPWGSICATDKRGGGEFSADDVAFLDELAALTVRAARPHLRADAREQQITALTRDRDAYVASNDIAKSLAGQPDLDHVTELIVKRGRALTGAQSSVLALAGVDGMVIEAVAGTIDRSLCGTRLPLADDERSMLLLHGPAVAERAGAFAALADRVRGAAVMVVPLVVRRQLTGVLVCIDPLDGSRGYSPHDRAIADAFGTSAAVAVASARSAQEQALQRAIAATERERAHWARELHDQTLQDFAAVKLLVSLARRATSDADRDDLLGQAATQIEASARDLRHLVAELRPAALDADGLTAALDGLVARLASGGGPQIVLSCSLRAEGADGSGDRRLPPTVESIVYRIVQEALTNAVRHAGADRISVDVVLEDRLLTATIRDAGVGFDAGARSGGFGLIGMRERAELVDGHLRVDSRPGGGTTVTLTAPIDAGAGE